MISLTSSNYTLSRNLGTSALFFSPYSEVPTLIYDWHIQPSPQANATAYWQHLFVKHQAKLAEHYGAKEAKDIPRGLNQIFKRVLFYKTSLVYLN